MLLANVCNVLVSMWFQAHLCKGRRSKKNCQDSLWWVVVHFQQHNPSRKRIFEGFLLFFPGPFHILLCKECGRISSMAADKLFWKLKKDVIVRRGWAEDGSENVQKTPDLLIFLTVCVFNLIPFTHTHPFGSGINLFHFASPFSIISSPPQPPTWESASLLNYILTAELKFQRQSSSSWGSAMLNCKMISCCLCLNTANEEESLRWFSKPHKLPTGVKVGE